MEGKSAVKLTTTLELDWNKLLPANDDDDDDPPPCLVIVKSKTLAGENRKEPPAMDPHAEKHESYEQMTDHVLRERIKSTRQSIPKIAHTLPDKGEKLRGSLKHMEAEMNRRKLRRVETIHLEEPDGDENPTQSISSGIMGASKDFRTENTKSQDQRRSSFGSSFCRRMEQTTNHRTGKAFDKEISFLGPCNNPQKMRNIQEFSQKRRYRDLSPRHSPSKRQRDKHKSNGNEKSKASAYSQDIREKFSNFYAKKKEALSVSNSNDSRLRKGETIVLVDEEEPQIIETKEDEPQLKETEQQMEKPDESMKDVKIYYPSRDDPKSVEISYADFDCLAPEAYLTSTIMNFYMRYLQQHASPTNKVMHDCHFFNTYFYNKLKEAVSYKGTDKDKFFVKFRRWWKGVNIFQKKFILIPINETLHWSLVIICNPDKEEQSGPIVLHLDSLGLHSSIAVFQNIKSYLKEEWHYLAQEVSPSDLPFAENIWKNLPRRIMDKTIAVPQQKNEYDCGPFVLFFMERFIEDAPGRLKKKDLEMFGKQWFKPEEASGLRGKIHKLLLEEFKNAQKRSCTLESSPSSASDLVEE